jgi:hypothetical protein
MERINIQQMHFQDSLPEDQTSNPVVQNELKEDKKFADGSENVERKNDNINLQERNPENLTPNPVMQNESKEDEKISDSSENIE